MSAACRLCESKDHSTEYSIGEYTILKCRKCGFVFSDPLPGEEIIYSLYKTHYFNSSKNLGYADYKENEKIRKKTFEHYFELIKPYLKKSSAALDIGCADGSFMNILSTNGFNEVEGIELSEEMFEETGRKFVLYNNPIEKTSIKKKYDLITLFDVLEHIPDLKSAVQNMSTLLNSEGLLVILTPDYGSFQRKAKGKNWFQFKPMEHINYFTRKRLKQFLNSNGFEILHTSNGISMVDKDFIKDRLRRYNYSFLGLLFKLFGTLFFGKREFIKISNSSIFIIAKRV